MLDKHDDNISTLGDILAQAKANMVVPQPSRLPRPVEVVAAKIEQRFNETAIMLDDTAEKLRARANHLAQKAQDLREMSRLSTEIREWVAFEQLAFDEVKSLALIDVGMRQD